MNVRHERYGFDDLPNSSSLMAAVDGLNKGITPVRTKLKKFKSIIGYVNDMRAGRVPLAPYLMERYSRANVLPDF